LRFGFGMTALIPQHMAQAGGDHGNAGSLRAGLAKLIFRLGKLTPPRRGDGLAQDRRKLWTGCRIHDCNLTKKEPSGSPAISAGLFAHPAKYFQGVFGIIAGGCAEVNAVISQLL